MDTYCSNQVGRGREQQHKGVGSLILGGCYLVAGFSCWLTDLKQVPIVP